MKLKPEPAPRRAPHLSEEYVAYLDSPAWATTRATMLELAGHRCQGPGCGVRTGLQVHHRHYRSLGNEAWGDLVVLCPSCHLDADRRRQSARRHR